MPESSQLIDITGNGKMKMLYEAYTEPEPHFAQLIHKDVLKNTIEVYPKARTTTSTRSGTPRTPR